MPNERNITDETWGQRVQRVFADLANKRELDPKYTEEQNRQLMLADAQYRADKEMFDDIHYMLRQLLKGTTV
jgi:hypothetical protein